MPCPLDYLIYLLIDLRLPRLMKDIESVNGCVLPVELVVDMGVSGGGVMTGEPLLLISKTTMSFPVTFCDF